jgi:hypothetical protein
LNCSALNANGTVDSTTNLPVAGNAGSVVFDAVPLVIGQSYQVQANVRGVDGARTDVVTAQASVRRRPDLTIAFGGPSRAPVATAVVVTARVSNLGSDVGARADCLLYIGDASDIADEAPGIWVDGNDSVSCVFSHVFNQVGSQRVRVAVANAVPADDDTSNNEASSVIDIFDDLTPQVTWFITKSRTVTDQAHLHSEGHITFEYPRQGSPSVRGSDWNYDYVYTVVANESTELSLTSLTNMFYPLASFDLSGSSGGQSTASMHETNVQPDSVFGDATAGGTYLSRYDAATGTVVYLQTYFDPITVSTYLYAQRVASRTTYWASGYTHYWMSWAPGQDIYVYYTPRDDAAGALSPVLDETMTMQIVDAAGRTFGGGGTVTPSSQEQWVDLPLACRDAAQQTIFGYETLHVCQEQVYHSVASYGTASGTTGSY